MQLNHLQQVVWPLLVAIGLTAYSGLAAGHLANGTLRDANTPQTLAWYGLAFAAYLAAIYCAEKKIKILLRVIWGAAVLFRLLLLFTTPTLSDDVYRYIWDGHVANNGVSPYARPVSDPELDPLDIPERAMVNNDWMASPYLPAAQGVFSGLDRFFPRHPFFFQLAAVAFDLLSGLVIAALLQLGGWPRKRLLIYLWNPLVVMESAHGAHIDAWMILLTLTAVWLTLARPRSAAPVLAPVSLALATLTKLLPALLLPVLFWRWRWWQFIVFGLVIVTVLLPAGLDAGWGLSGPLDGAGLFGALRIYGAQWNFNSGLFHWLEVTLQRWSSPAAGQLARQVMSLALLALLAIVWLLARRVTETRPLLRLMAVPFIGYILLTTTVHPWYLLILLAFVPFLTPAAGEPSRWWWLAAPWLYLSGALALSYLTYIDPSDFREFEGVRLVEWFPTLMLIILPTLYWGLVRLFRKPIISL